MIESFFIAGEDTKGFYIFFFIINKMLPDGITVTVIS
jgi:hypothetical protein